MRTLFVIIVSSGVSLNITTEITSQILNLLLGVFAGSDFTDLNHLKSVNLLFASHLRIEISLCYAEFPQIT